MTKEKNRSLLVCKQDSSFTLSFGIQQRADPRTKKGYLSFFWYLFSVLEDGDHDLFFLPTFVFARP